MNLELTIYELGKLLKKINADFPLEILTKMQLSGGWMTIQGEANIDSVPSEGLVLGCSNKSNNIINIKVKTGSLEGAEVKLTGLKGKKFNINIASTRFKEVYIGNTNPDEIKINNGECKIRIDNDIIFKVGISLDEIKGYI